MPPHPEGVVYRRRIDLDRLILVDTSVWIGFYRGSHDAVGVAGLLEENLVLMHPWIAGELALENLGPQRAPMLKDLQLLPAADVIPDREVLDFIESRRLYNRGIGWVDAQLLGSALLSGARFWTFDGPATRAARELGIPVVP